MDYAHGLIDKRIEELEKRLADEYSVALSEIQDRAMEYFDKFAKQDAAKLKLVKSGELSKKEYTEWRKNKMLYGKRYDVMINDLAKKLTETDKMAMQIVGQSLTGSFSDAANYTAYEIEKVMGGEANFTVYNQDAVNNLVKNDPELLPRPSVPIAEDLRWNKSKLNSAITQGILQGDPIPRLASRLQLVTDMDRRAAIRNARTMHTAAESVGRQNSYERASDMGIEIKREWIATQDDRTRDAHRELDGMIVGLDEPFENSIGKIMYPADPSADPSNVYNCRCTIRGYLPNHPYHTERYSGADYEAWKDGKLAYQRFLEGTK